MVIDSATFGSKLKIIRSFRGLTQKQLGVMVGFDEKNADVRVRHYELGIITPKKDGMLKIAQILKVNYINFCVEEIGSDEHIMQFFFWIDELSKGTFKPIQLEKIPQKKYVKLNPNHSENDMTVSYHENDNWPAFTPMAMLLNRRNLSGYVQEWANRKYELSSGEITKEEYLEWKLNWPQTCDDCGKREPTYKWRLKEEGNA